MPGILNYTTKVPADRTIQEIQAILIKAGADALQMEAKEGRIKSVSFRMNTDNGIIYYKLPADMHGVKRAMMRDRVRHSDMDAQAYRVSWRIVKDWIEAQMAIIQANMAETAQVFLPYAITGTGQTVFERFKTGGVGTIGITYNKGDKA